MKKAITLLLCAVFLLGTVSYATPGGDVIVVSMEGDVKVTPSGKASAQACELGMKLTQGAKITTGRDSSVELAFDKTKRNIVKIVANSNVVIKLDGADKIELINGEIYALLKGLKKGETFRVRTPSAVCGARGTAWKTGVFGNVTEVFGLQNKVFTRGIKPDGKVMEKMFWVLAGMQRRIEKGKEPGDMTKTPKDKFAAMKKLLGLGIKKKGFGGWFFKKEEHRKTLRDRKKDKRRGMMKEPYSNGNSDREEKFEKYTIE